MDTQALWVTLRLASVTTLILLAISIPLAWWLARGQGAWRTAVRWITMLPLVLPPTVLGFYLLVLLGPATAPGRWLASIFGHPLSFTFTGLVLGSIIYSLPFAVQPLFVGFAAVPQLMLDAAATLGADRRQQFRRVALPMSIGPLISAAALVFAHTVGEFGVVLMLGGNIPGATRTLSIAIYDQVQDFDYAAANHTALALLALSLIGLFALDRLGNERSVAEPVLTVELDHTFRESRFRLRANFASTAGWTVLFGPSGAGKSSILRAVAGLLRPQSGHIRFGDEDWTNISTRNFVPPQWRNIGYVSQAAALFPHLSVAQNIHFSRPYIHRDMHADMDAGQLLEMFHCSHLADRRPHDLSGGEQQRVALARALARRPQLLLLDEPFRGLDAELQAEILGDLNAYLAQHSVPVLSATHDVLEILTVNAHVLRIREGTTIGEGPAREMLVAERQAMLRVLES